MGSIPVERTVRGEQLTSRNDETFMKVALEEARRGYESGEVPVGAVVVKDGQVIGKAHNDRESTKDPLGHAELRAIQEASRLIGDWRLDGCVMYVTLEPCPMCAGAILQSRFEKVVYGAGDEKAGACGTVMNIPDYPGFGACIEVTPGVLENECRKILKSFFRDRRGDGKTWRDG